MNSRPTIKRVRRAFLAGAVRSTGELVRWVWPRQSRFKRVQYDRVRAAARELADVVGRVHRGRSSSAPGGLIWRARDPLPELVERQWRGSASISARL
jgi:hypothetical protein